MYGSQTWYRVFNFRPELVDLLLLAEDEVLRSFFVRVCDFYEDWASIAVLVGVARGR